MRSRRPSRTKEAPIDLWLQFAMAEASRGPYADAIALLDAELTYAEVLTFLYHHSGGPSPSTPPVLD